MVRDIVDRTLDDVIEYVPASARLGWVLAPKHRLTSHAFLHGSCLNVTFVALFRHMDFSVSEFFVSVGKDLKRIALKHYFIKLKYR